MSHVRMSARWFFTRQECLPHPFDKRGSLRPGGHPAPSGVQTPHGEPFRSRVLSGGCSGQADEVDEPTLDGNAPALAMGTSDTAGRRESGRPHCGTQQTRVTPALRWLDVLGRDSGQQPRHRPDEVWSARLQAMVTEHPLHVRHKRRGHSRLRPDHALPQRSALTCCSVLIDSRAEGLSGCLLCLTQPHQLVACLPGQPFPWAECGDRRQPSHPDIRGGFVVVGGLRATRALLTLLALAVATVLFATVGFGRLQQTVYVPVRSTNANQPVAYKQTSVPDGKPGFREAAYNSVQSATSLLREPTTEPLTTIGRIVEIALRLLGPLLLGLAVLALARTSETISGEIISSPRDDSRPGTAQPSAVRRKTLDLSIRDNPVHVTVFGGQAGGDVIAAEQDLQRPAAADQAPQARHGAAAGDGADTNFELALDRLLGRKADVGGENELAARAARAAPDL
jgi:hypothetical protein